MKTSTAPFGDTASAAALLYGAIPRSGRPSSDHTIASHWKPACPDVKPRSTTSSARVPGIGRPSSNQSAGASPVTRNHVVPQGRPQG